MPGWTRARTEQLAVLGKEYAELLPGRVDEIRQLCEALTIGDNDEQTFRTIENRADLLGGNAAGFGFTKVTEVARGIAFVVRGIRRSGGTVSAADTAEIGRKLTALEKAIAEPDSPGPWRADAAESYSASRSRRHRVFEDHRLIFIYEEDEHGGQQLALQLNYFGYHATSFSSMSSMREAIEAQVPAAVVLDVMSPERDLAQVNALEQLRSATPMSLPILVMSTRRDLSARLASVRAGGNEYLVKPVDIVELVDKLDGLTSKKPPDPYRVLLVDYQQRRAAKRAEALAHAGMRTEEVADPLWVMEPLVNFRPDVILMDVEMPKYDGIELAAAVRQQEAYVGIPIVFCSRDARITQRLAKSGFGGEPFLIEPFDPRFMITTVETLAERSRVLQSLMVRDALTGLFNQTRIKEQLHYEVQRSRRDTTPLSYAMIDIDNFKAVNDTYGHPTGDRVLKTLARLLQQRLRRTDFIGRYGGDEFAVILPSTPAPDAVSLLDGIRVSFSQAREGWVSDEQRSGFSCGIAGLRDGDDGSKLNQAADDALYEAKRAGRNQIILAATGA